MNLEILIATVALLTGSVVHLQEPPEPPAPPNAGVLDRLPLAFVENQGQWDDPARFVARSGPLVARAEPGALVVQLERRDESGTGEVLVARLEFEGAKESVELVGEDPQPGVRHYYVGDHSRCRTGVRAFSKVLYRGVHEGIDLRLREGDGRLEYDLLLEPSAELEGFVVRCEGVEALAIEEDGSLVMETALGPLRHTPPETWQVLPDGERLGLPGHFVLLDERRFGFALEERLPGLPVVIDPGLEWATYLGGTLDDAHAGARLDPQGRVVMAGWTYSGDLQATSGALKGTTDAWVAMLDPSLSGPAQLLWLAYVGGARRDKFWELELDAAGNIFAVGSSRSLDLPCTGDPYDSSLNGIWDAMVCELDPSGAIQYLSYFGGSDNEAGVKLEVQEPRIVTFAGATLSSDLDMVGSYNATHAGSIDYYIARLDLNQPSSTQLTYSTYLGGTGQDGVPDSTSLGTETWKMNLDLLPSGEVALTGFTSSGDFPTQNPYQSAKGAYRDSILAIIDPTQGAAGLSYSTFLGGNANDGGLTLEADDAGVLTLGGFTKSTDFPTTAGAFDTSLHVDPHEDAFLVRLDPRETGAAQLLYSTYLGAEGYEWLTDLRVDGEGGVFAIGSTGYLNFSSSSFPTTCGTYDNSFNGFSDCFVVYLFPGGHGTSDLCYSTFFGGSHFDPAWSIELLPGVMPTVLCGLSTYSPDCPLENEFQGHQGGLDAFAFRLELNPHNYCIAAANSAGPDGALICGTGSVSNTVNNFTLSVSGAIPNQAGLFYFGPTAIEVPFGHGFRCAGGGITRLSPALFTDNTGCASRWVDLWSPPGDQLTPGVPWHFQFWYRDPAAGGAGFNFSNGLKAVFHP